ncbi:MAG TPA: hypothetical protein VMT35_07490 [Ignavibacteriaceae bacterium]|nr:hypothetical protein [Ignavibacteriaceae bacterium]
MPDAVESVIPMNIGIFLGEKRCISNAEYRIWDAGFRIPDSGYRMLDT